VNTQALFGEQFSYEQVASCRVNRLRVQVGGIQTAIARVALGGQRTQIWLTLADGRKLGSLARDDPQHAQALEQFLDELERHRVNHWLAEIGRGQTVAFGKVTFTRDHMQVGRKVLAWRDIGGWSMREGGFMVDGKNHRMVFNMWIATTPWVGAIAYMVEAMAPGKNYATWPDASLPRVGFTATSALTHIPGTMTMRGRGYLLLALIAVPLIGLAGYWVMMERDRARMQAHYTSSARTDGAELAPKLADPAFAEIAPCKPSEYGHWTEYLAAVRVTGKETKLTRGKRPVSELDTYPTELLVWDVVGDKVRGILLTDRFGGDGPKLCSHAVPGSTLDPLLEKLEHKATKEEIAAFDAEASRQSATDSVRAIAANIDDAKAPGSQAADPSTEPSKPPSDTKKVTSATSSGAKPGLAPAAIAKVVKGNQSRIRACYDRALLSNPDAAGRIDVKLEIARTGKVSSAKAGDESTLAASLNACVLKVFKAMKFPSSKSSTKVSYPVVFASQ
jgi:hypothetical protein